MKRRRKEVEKKSKRKRKDVEKKKKRSRKEVVLNLTIVLVHSTVRDLQFRSNHSEIDFSSVSNHHFISSASAAWRGATKLTVKMNVTSGYRAFAKTVDVSCLSEVVTISVVENFCHSFHFTNNRQTDICLNINKCCAFVFIHL